MILEPRKFRAVSSGGDCVPMIAVPVLVGDQVEIRFISEPVEFPSIFLEIEIQDDQGHWSVFYECQRKDLRAVNKGERWEIQFAQVKP